MLLDRSKKPLKMVQSQHRNWIISLLHQANIRILDKMAKKIGVDRDKLPANMTEYGNTSAASIPILLSECVENGMIRLDGSQTILLSGFGGGLTWGTLILTI